MVPWKWEDKVWKAKEVLERHTAKKQKTAEHRNDGDGESTDD